MGVREMTDSDSANPKPSSAQPPEWHRMLVQARRFAAAGNYIDALGRLDTLRQQIAAATPSPATTGLKRVVDLEHDRVAKQWTAIRERLEAERRTQVEAVLREAEAAFRPDGGPPKRKKTD